jgi:hypothetical protein
MSGGSRRRERAVDVEEVMALVRLTREEASGKLPLVCVRCGAPAIGFRTKKNWYPPWANVFVLVLFVPLLILSRRVRLRLPFCSDHYDHWLLRSIVVWGSLVAAWVLSFMLLVAFAPRRFLSGEPEPAVTLSVSYTILICWAIFAITLQRTSVRPCKLTKEFIEIRGVAPAFVESLKRVGTPRQVAPIVPEAIADADSHVREGYPPSPLDRGYRAEG